MIYIKLQIGCLLVILYIVVTYVKATLGEKLVRNRYFDALMVTAPWAVIFDGVTSWTVNHQDVVPAFWNDLAHLLFFVFMDLTILVTAMYMYDQTVGFHKNNNKMKLLFCLPEIISLVLTVVGMGQLSYLHGQTTNYSMGFSVYVCYATVILYYGAIFWLVTVRHKFLPKDKLLGTLSFIVICGTILVVQIVFPEVLLTAIFPTILVLGIYVDFENPAIRKLTIHNERMIEGFATLVENRDNNTGGHIKKDKGLCQSDASQNAER